MERRTGRRLLLVALVVSLCATAAVAIATLLFGDFGDAEGRILATTALISVYSLLALPAGILLDARRLRPLAWATLALCVAGFALAQVLVWGEGDGDELGKLALTLGVFLVAASQTSAGASRLREGDSRAVRSLFVASTALVLLLAVLAAVAIWGEVDDETFWRVLAALVVANVLLVVLQPVLRRLGGAPPAAHRLRVVLADGAERELEVRDRDFAGAVARAVRDAERDGAEVERIERIPPR